MYQVKVTVPHFQTSHRLTNQSLVKICVYFFLLCWKVVAPAPISSIAGVPDTVPRSRSMLTLDHRRG